MVLTDTARLWPAKLTGWPASESNSAGHSAAAAFERAGLPCRPPVLVDTYLLDGVERPGLTRPEVLADRNGCVGPRSGLSCTGPHG